jgi:hypothetical protein
MLSFIKFAAHQSRIESMSDCRRLQSSGELIIIIIIIIIIIAADTAVSC